MSRWVPSEVTTHCQQLSIRSSKAKLIAKQFRQELLLMQTRIEEDVDKLIANDVGGLSPEFVERYIDWEEDELERLYDEIIVSSKLSRQFILYLKV